MKSTRLFLYVGFLFATGRLPAATLYVDGASPNPVAPYTNWATAARVIQDAVDSSVAGDEVVVANGVYAAGGRAVSGAVTNRVAVDRAITLRSMNGPGVTLIDGAQAMRCAYLTNGAVLAGFTLTHGNADNGGGVFCASLTASVVSNCILTANSAATGGGVYSGTLNNCTVAANSSTGSAGGAMGSILNNCVLAANVANMYSGMGGGGASSATLSNCSVTGNSAVVGGGANMSTLVNCTVVANVASAGGGGTYAGALLNCIVYFNTSRTYPNSWRDFVYYSCTTPMPTNGTGNMTNDPALASLSHISAASPCRGAGSAAYVSNVDIDGEAWLNPPSIGCDEYRVGAVTGDLAVAVGASWTNVATGFQVALTAMVNGRAESSVWDFGDGTGLTNQPCPTHRWMAAGNYPVVLRVFNESNPGGVSTTQVVSVLAQPVFYVSAASTNPVAPYISWETAAANIQDAVDAAAPGGIVLVTNGLYATGGRRANTMVLTNRLVVDKPITVQSVNGAKVTVIRGYQMPGQTIGPGAIRCLYLTNDVLFSGFTLTNGATLNGGNHFDTSGGGVLSEQAWPPAGPPIMSNCILSGNSAAGLGGGACYGILINCVAAGNRSMNGGGGGGGAAYAILTSSTVASNWSMFGSGGAYGCILTNSIVYYNSQTLQDRYEPGSSFTYCCTTTLPTSGTGNITTEPLFVDPVNGNFRLQSNSPCINAGNNAYAPGPTDVDGNPRIVNGTMDMGAYEWQVPAKFAPLTRPGPGGLALSISGETNRVYSIQASSNLMNWFWLGQFTNVPGQPPFTDPLAPPPPARFYKASPVP